MFQRAIELDRDARSRWLDENCHGDMELRDEVMRLLTHADAAAPAFLVGDPPSAGPLPGGTRVGRHRVVRLLGRGGMGEVYEAEQDQPRRRVALKLVRTDRAPAEARRRFQLECEVLGTLQHPGIAQVFEAGTAMLAGGLEQPYLAMELIEGVPLGEYARSAGLDLRARVELLARVCDAVQHAHEHGVIHRDLKPANVLVVDSPASEGGGRGQPKVLDFGVARLVAHEAVGFTRDGQVVGTLAYMSPEQMAGEGAAVDTRTDVYALGVMLYELLADRRAFDLEGLGLAQAVVALRERAPRPLGELSRALRGDLETIVSRAMHAEPARRYATAAQLGSDLRRHLSGEPIEARADSRSYVIGRSLRRHWRFSAAAAAFVLLLIAFAGASLLQARRNADLAKDAGRERDRSNERRIAAERATLEARHVNELMLSLFEAAQVGRSSDAELQVRELLDAFDERLLTTLTDQPTVLVNLLETVGKANRLVGRTQPAVVQLRAALALRIEISGAEAHEVANAHVALGNALESAGAREEAQVEFQRGLQLHAARGEACRGCVADILVALGRSQLRADRVALARAYLLEAEDLLTCGVSPPPRLHVRLLTAQAELASDQADLAGAEAYERAALERWHAGPEPPGSDVHESLSRLSVLARKRGELLEAERLARQALALIVPTHGSDHPTFAKGLNELGLIVFERGDVAQAEALFGHALDVLRDSERSTFGLRLSVRSNLALCARARGDALGALSLREQVLAERRALPGARTREVAMELSNIGALLHELGRIPQAEAHYREALSLHRELGGEHLELGNVLLNLGLQLERQSRWPEALEVFAESLELHQRYLGAHLRTFRSTRKVAESLVALERHAEAQEQFQAAIAMARDRAIGRAEDEASMTTKLADCLIELSRPAEVEPLERQALELWREARGECHVDVAQALCNLGASLCALERHAEAEGVLQQSLAVFEVAGADVARRALPEFWRASCEQRLRDATAGEAAMLLAAQHLIAAASVRSERRRRAFAALAELYESSGRAELALPWRERASR